MFLVLFVLHDPERANEVLDAWDSCGISGATILASAGMGRLRGKKALREDFPIIPSLSDLFEHEEVLNRTFITIVKNEALVDKLIEATEKVIGNLNLPNTGILAVLPVLRAFGLDREAGENPKPYS